MKVSEEARDTEAVNGFGESDWWGETSLSPHARLGGEGAIPSWTIGPDNGGGVGDTLRFLLVW